MKRACTSSDGSANLGTAQAEVHRDDGPVMKPRSGQVRPGQASPGRSKPWQQFNWGPHGAASLILIAASRWVWSCFSVGATSRLAGKKAGRQASKPTVSTIARLVR